MPIYGRNAVAEPLSALNSLHFHDGITPLKTVDHEPKIAVLDQEDLLAQGIRTSQLIKGARNVDALGSCTANTVIEALSNLLTAQRFASNIEALSTMFTSTQTIYTDTITAEKAAIVFYHRCTDQTGQSSEEWPPTDCGSSGPYIVSLCQQLGVASGAKIAHGADNIVSLMQGGGIMCGSPFLNAWEEPNALGFIDGDGSPATLQAQIRQGVAGGHEYFLSAIEKLTLLGTGHVDARNTVVRFRNHWTRSWGDHGSARVHLSTLVSLGGQADFRQLTPATA